MSDLLNVRVNELEDCSVFDTTDIVLIEGHDEYMSVVGVIHDEKRLFVSCSTKQEFETPFSSVESHFKKVT